MQAQYELAPMADWDDDERLNETDTAILERLSDGRETTGSLASYLDKHPQTVRDRLRWLREWGYVEYHHEPTGLHELEIRHGTEDVEEGEPVEDGGENGVVSDRSGEWHEDGETLIDEEAPD